MMQKGFFSDTEKNNYIKWHLDNCLNQYDKVNYVYAVMNKRNTDEMLIISDLSADLVDNYLKKKNKRIDPVVINALNSISPFPWDKDIKAESMRAIVKDPEMIKSFEQVFAPIKYFNISGYAFILHDHQHNLALLSLYIDNFLIKDVDSFINQHKDRLQGLLIHTHEMLLKIYQNEQQVNKVIFTSRESEILYWSSIGKTYPEIAIILDLSVSTIKFHMRNVVNKLGVSNAKHAISLSVELDLISKQK